MPAPGISYRTNGGVLDMYFFLGPNHENVVQQYTEVKRNSLNYAKNSKKLVKSTPCKASFQ